MDSVQYRKAIERTMNHSLSEKEKLAMLAMEIVDTLKKVIFHGHELDRDELIKELETLSGTCNI